MRLVLAMVVGLAVVPLAGAGGPGLACGSVSPLDNDCEVGPLVLGAVWGLELDTTGLVGRLEGSLVGRSGTYTVTCFGVERQDLQLCTEEGPRPLPGTVVRLRCEALPVSTEAPAPPAGPWGCGVSGVA